MLPLPPSPTLFPYTTLFRSAVLFTHAHRDQCQGAARAAALGVPLRFPEASEALRSEEHTSELQSPYDLVCRLLLEKKKQQLGNEQHTGRREPLQACAHAGTL